MATSEAGHVVIIADWPDDQAHSIRIQDFRKDDKSFIPVFSSKRAFDELTAGSPYADRAVSIDLEMLLSMMDADATLIINPGSKTPWVLRAARD